MESSMLQLLKVCPKKGGVGICVVLTNVETF